MADRLAEVREKIAALRGARDAEAFARLVDAVQPNAPRYLPVSIAARLLELSSADSYELLLWLTRPEIALFEQRFTFLPDEDGSLELDLDGTEGMLAIQRGALFHPELGAELHNIETSLFPYFRATEALAQLLRGSGAA